MAKKAEVIAILERLRCCFHPAPELEVETVSIYAKLLCEFPAPVLAEACLRIPKTSKWFPAISEIRAVCINVVAERRPALPPDPAILERHRQRAAEESKRAKARREEKPPEGLGVRETREWYEERGIRPWEGR